jgi:hypothetical protein
MYMRNILIITANYGMHRIDMGYGGEAHNDSQLADLSVSRVAHG